MTFLTTRVFILTTQDGSLVNKIVKIIKENDSSSEH